VSPDALDEVQNAAERELAIRNLDRESNMLRNVRAALHRINEGTFGVCAHCEEDISLKRLNAVPWAAYCIQCQEVADRNQEEGTDSLDDLLVHAA
jgi:DnaK suppressor protein